MAAASGKEQGKAKAAEGDEEFDKILGGASIEGLATSEDRTGRPAPSPIPANRMALISKIEEQNRLLRERQRIRNLGYQTMLVMAIIVAICLLAILVWLFYISIANGVHGAIRQETTIRFKEDLVKRPPPLYIEHLDMVLGKGEAHAPDDQFRSARPILMMPKKLPKVRIYKVSNGMHDGRAIIET